MLPSRTSALHSFPVELLCNIFEQLIDVPTDDEFLCMDSDRRFGYAVAPWYLVEDERLRTPERRPPALLLVCKTWQRVCTPILYRTAIIRSKGQAEALYHGITVLHPDLATRVKRLRLEGVFGMDVYRLLKATTNLTHLAISLRAFSTDGISPVCRALRMEHINPTVLILADTTDGSKNRLKLVEALADVVTTWTKLETVHVPCLESRFSHTTATSTAMIIMALATSPALRTVVMPLCHRPKLAVLRILSESRSLRQISFVQGMSRGDYRSAEMRNAYEDAIAADSRLHALCKYDTEDGKPIVWKDSYTTLKAQLLARQSKKSKAESAPIKPAEPELPPPDLRIHTEPVEVQRKIWANVLSLIPVVGWQNEISSLYRCSRVCKMWRQLALPLMLHTVNANSEKKRAQLIQAFELNPALGQYVRDLSLDATMDEGTVDIQKLMAYTPNVTVLKSCDLFSFSYIPRADCAPKLRWSQFTALPMAAAELQEIKAIKIAKEFAPQASAQADTSNSASAAADLSSSEEQKPTKKEISVPLGPLIPFRALAVLQFGASVKLRFKKSDVPPDIFPALEDLHFNSCHTSILKLFALFELPALRSLGLHGRAQTGLDAGDFLEAHGPKIDSLDIQYFPTESVLEMCPALRTLRVRERKPPPKYSADSWRSATLRTIHFTYDLPAQIQAMRPWGDILSSIDPDKLPKLRVIHMGVCWPLTERAIASDFWVPHAEAMLAKGIEIRNGRGLPWHPRVKARRVQRRRKSEADIDMDTEDEEESDEEEDEEEED
ncbi:hypothetical protein HDZ31DRAFT_47110 [Schizophyllum fasciatum]